MGCCFDVLGWRRYGSFSSVTETFFVILFSLQMVSATVTFFLANSLYPEVQAKAQREIDQVVETNRLPSYKDQDSLPALAH